MKKTTIIVALVLGATMFLFSGCAKKLDKCSDLSDKVSTASEAFTNNPTQATCEDYFDAIQGYYDGCTAIPAITKSIYDAWLESVDCSAY